MSTSALVVADSISPLGHRLTTVEVVLWRPLLAELNTHRNQSKNSASSRARSMTVTFDEVASDPAMPLEWPSEQPGMQGGTQLEGRDLDDAQQFVKHLHMLVTGEMDQYLRAHPEAAHRLHKSVLNRYLEPWMWHKALLSATDWSGFFAQRIYGGAQAEMRELALRVREAIDHSTPRRLGYGGWHTPYVEMGHPAALHDQLTMSVARCARTSTGRSHFDTDLAVDQALFDVMRAGGHCSPFEHVATPTDDEHAPGNFTGWAQLRHVIGLDRIMLALDPANREVTA